LTSSDDENNPPPTAEKVKIKEPKKRKAHKVVTKWDDPDPDDEAMWECDPEEPDWGNNGDEDCDTTAGTGKMDKVVPTFADLGVNFTWKTPAENELGDSWPYFNGYDESVRCRDMAKQIKEQGYSVLRDVFMPDEDPVWYFEKPNPGDWYNKVMNTWNRLLGVTFGLDKAAYARSKGWFRDEFKACVDR
jgi:hypothetical protein